MAHQHSPQQQGLLVQAIKRRDDQWQNKTHQLRDGVIRLRRELERVKLEQAKELESRGREAKSLRAELARAQTQLDTKSSELDVAQSAKASLASQMDNFLRRADESIEKLTSELEQEKQSRAKDSRVCTRTWVGCVLVVFVMSPWLRRSMLKEKRWRRTC